MVDISADVSSYPKPAALPAQQSLLGNVAQYQQLDQGNVNLQRSRVALTSDKLDLINKEYTNVISRLSSAGKNVDANGLSAIVDQTVKDGLIPPELAANVKGRIPSDPSAVPAYRDQLMQQLVDGQQKINNYHGSMGISPAQLATPTNIPNAQTGRTDQGTLGQFLKQTGSPLLNENRLPVQQGGGAPGTPMQNRPRLPVQQPQGQGTPVQGQSPSLDSAVTQLATDRKSAADLNAGNVPLMDVIRLASKMQANTGKGTPTLNEVRAFMYNAGWLKDSQADATTVYQELNKKLKQVAGNQPGANQSDLGRIDASESNPNAKTQILPALLNVAKDNLAQNRMAIAKTNSFDAKGPNTNPNDYPTHAANFTTSQERDAYKFDTLPKDQQTKLLKDKLDAAKITIVDGEPVMGKGGDKNAFRFIKSLDLARKQKLLNYSE